MSLRTLEKMLFLHITKYNSPTRTGASRLFVYFQIEDTTTQISLGKLRSTPSGLQVRTTKS